jgi:hypothetical protein
MAWARIYRFGNPFSRQVEVFLLSGTDLKNSMCVRNEDRSPVAVHMKELQKVPRGFARKNP